MDTDFDNKLSEVLTHFKIKFKLKPLQKLCLQMLVNKSDVFAVLPTGYGKSLIYTLLPKLTWEMTRPDGETERTSNIVLVISPLVSLMQDQVINLESHGLECAYLGQQHTDEIHQKIMGGKIPLILATPESLFSGSWRELIMLPVYQQCMCTIVIDECHCVEQWGEEFRTSYARLGELRSLLPNANLLALTATATPQMQKKIAHLLCMTEYELVVGNCDRPNINHFCIRAPKTIPECFSWLVASVEEHKNNTPKCIIYCRNIKSCGLIYVYLKRLLGDEHCYYGQPSAKNCYIGMYHHSTSPKNKKIISDNFPKSDSKVRIVIATTAFGMGVNIPDIRLVIHWGAPHSFHNYLQQSGRAGRDDLMSLSIVYYHPSDISSVATDEHMRTFCTTDKCRRKYLVSHFTPENSPCNTVKHFCCDICKESCICGSCPENHPACLDPDDKTLSEVLDDTEVRPYRFVRENQRAVIKSKIDELRSNMISESNSDYSMLNVKIITGLSDKVIADIVGNVHYIFSLENILTEYWFDDSTAQDIFDIIESVLVS